jgi:hypothetical protein
VAAVLVWLAAASAYPSLVLRARRRGGDAELLARRRLQYLIALEAAAFAFVLATGCALMHFHGWSLAYPRWLALKIGLVSFLFLPLEGFLAYVGAAWIRPGLRATLGPPLAKELARGGAMQEMVWAIAVPLAGLALPLVVWLSLARPF